MTGSYDALGLYHGPDDPRLIVPKSNPMMGWTVNVAHPRAPLLLLGIGALIGGAITSAVLHR